jgi:eukaryotic-like serine/threonine-protein kinase
MSGELSTEWSFSGVLVRLYATVCENTFSPPDLEAFLHRYRHIDPRQHADVLLFDQYHRWRIGTQRPVEWYLERFTHLNPFNNWRLELLLEEFGYREEHGENPTVEEFLDRFPEYAEDLRKYLPYRDEHRRFAARADLLSKPFHAGTEATTRFLNSTVDASANPGIHHWDLGAHCEVETSLAEDSPFDQLPANVMDEIEARMHPRSFAPGEYLMRQGEPGTSLMVLLEGQVEVTVQSETGPSRLITRTDACQVFGEMSLLAEEPRTANVIALTPVVANVLPAESFHELVGQNPSISVVLTKLISQRLGRAGRMDVLAGRTLGGYQIVGRLGRGGMAVVYEALDPVNDRPVALKMMSHRLVYDQAALDQFQREADIIESFDHLNITRMHGRFKAFHTYFTVMQYCDGITLRDVIQKNGRLPQPIVRGVLGQLASALKYAHAQGIVHRDIKPANVMVNRDGTVMLMDFGLAKPADDGQSSLLNLIVGTPRYMAPEQMVGGLVDQVSDYFAMGCVIHEMLIGEPLIPETDWLNLLRHHANWKLPSFERLCPGLDPVLRDVLNGCLQSDPKDRILPLEELSKWSNPIEVHALRGFESLGD